MNFARLSVLCAPILLAACGGSDGDNSFINNPPAATTFQITQANGPTAARVSWEAAIASSELADLGGALGISASVPNGVSKASHADPASFLIRVMQKVPFGPDVYPCLDSGAMIISGDVADPFTLTLGDTFSIESQACDDGLGEVVSGLIEMTVREFTGDVQGLFMLGMDVTVTDLEVLTGTDTITSNGDVTVTLDTMQSPIVEAGTSGSRISTVTNTSTEVLTNYQSSQSVNAGVSPSPYTLGASGTLDTTQLDGIVTYSTPTIFEGWDVSYPYTGVLLVEGDNSSARLIAVDDTLVTIEIDSNGDGNVDSTIETTWADLTD